MKVFSAKTDCSNGGPSPWASSQRGILLFICLFACNYASARSKIGLDYTLNLWNRLALHTNAPHDLQYHRYWLEYEQNIKLNPTVRVVAGFRTYADAAFALNERYNGPVRQEESQQFLVRDLYLEHRSPSILVRIGNQQVVWGEAFGFYFADIVNPKDTRDFGLMDLTMQRLQTPMINSVLFFPNSSLQILFIPKPFFNLNPSQGNDFAFPQAKLFPQGTVTVKDIRSLPLALNNSEGGVRYTRLINGFDLALFAFYYLDRFPTYKAVVTSQAPLVIELQSNPKRNFTLGFTGTKEVSSWILRWETLITFGRSVDSIVGSNYSSIQSNEILTVGGLDYTAFERVRPGFQISHNHLTKTPQGSFVPPNRTVLSGHLNITVWRDHLADLILAYCPQDGSSSLRTQYQLPLSDRSELRLGADILEGSGNSLFGSGRRGSRVYGEFRVYLKEGGT